MLIFLWIIQHQLKQMLKHAADIRSRRHTICNQILSAHRQILQAQAVPVQLHIPPDVLELPQIVQLARNHIRMMRHDIRPLHKQE